MATVHVVIPDAGTVNWSGAGAIGSTDIVSLEQTGGNDNGTFVLDTAAVSCGGITVQAAKKITIKATNNGTVNINGNWTNLWKIWLTGTSIIKCDASIAAADCLLNWQSVATVVGIVSVIGAKIQLVGTAAYRILMYETGMIGGTNHLPTLIGYTYGVITGNAGIIDATYTYILGGDHLHGRNANETLVLTDSALIFNVVTEPEEEIIAGTLTMVRSVIGSYLAKVYYIKPTGALSVTRGWFDNLLPTFYSASYYVVLLNRTTKCQVKFRALEIIDDSFLGSDGSYIEITGHKSSYVIVQGSARYSTWWDHPLAQRKFLAQLMDLKAAAGELVKFTWHEGHFPKAFLREHDDNIDPGMDFYTGKYDFQFNVIEAPYN
jgi:hypothetical protein